MTQPEALRLADALDDEFTQGRISNHTGRKAAAELRRLHGLDFALRDCELALNKMATKYMDASDQRDALLEALQRALNVLDATGAQDEATAARAAIWAVEEGK